VIADERKGYLAATDQLKHHAQIASDPKFENTVAQLSEPYTGMAMRETKGAAYHVDGSMYLALPFFGKGADGDAKGA
jgi:hypothetical protein